MQLFEPGQQPLRCETQLKLIFAGRPARSHPDTSLPSLCPMKQSLQVFASRAAARSEPQSSSYRNFLIIAPASAGECPVYDEQVAALSRDLSQDGYTYVARAGQAQMEDDPSGVRHLPLREALPSFGHMTAVVVAGDPGWAERAAAEYHSADIFLMQPAILSTAPKRTAARKSALVAQPAEALQGAA